ncbi:MAG: hypothetical protein JOS17DRAFT_757369 [Linnemannia elongata]|nr:MAG: hypothetical protein JOS17DRAFT_757369 [Linnemannia elongata]
MTSLQTSSRFNILLIPEIIDQIASSLTPPDLRKATLVSHEWNIFFTPHLWRTIDDSLYAWPRIFGINDPKYIYSPQTKEWAQRVISKNHRHIRHFSISSSILIGAAADTLLQHNNNNNSNWNIKSFCFWEMKTLSTGSNERALEKAVVLAQVSDILRFSTNTLLSLTIGGSFLPNPDGEPNHSLFKTLRGLSNIVSFHCGQEFRFLLSEVSNNWPRLTTLTTSNFAHNEDVLMTRPIPGLRSLVLRFPITLQVVLHVLDNLPDLEFFKISHIDDAKKGVPVQQTTPTIDLVPHLNLKCLNLGWCKYKEDNTYWTLFSVLPFLTALKTKDLGHDISQAIATHCSQLEVLVDHKKPKVAYAAEILNELSALEPILQSCPNLRVLDALGHRLVVSVMSETPWATTKLETLRCQIRGLTRLDQVEEERYSRALNLFQKKGRKHNTRRAEIMQRYQVCLDDHTRLYAQLARQTQLRILELGFDHRVKDYRRASGYSDPVKDTPELSLKSGLGLLWDLKELEVFGFEGFEHRIGTEELDWMAENWPRLRMLRGLQKDTFHQIQFDEHKALLRKHLQKLRPEVEHESLGAYDVYAFWQ